jgi:hypothetical protein
VKESVSHLHLISCPSSFHFLAALKIIKPEATRISQLNGGIAAVLVDNVAAHYYIDRAIKSGCGSTTPIVPPGGTGGGGGINGGSTRSQGISLALGKVHTSMVVGLRNLQHSLRVPIIATKHVFSTTTPSYIQGWLVETRSRHRLFIYLFFFCREVLNSSFVVFVGGRGGGDSSWAYRDVMLKPWQDFVTHRLVLKKIPTAGGGGGGGGVGAAQGHVAKWIKPDVPVDDRFRVRNIGIVAS